MALCDRAWRRSQKRICSGRVDQTLADLVLEGFTRVIEQQELYSEFNPPRPFPVKIGLIDAPVLAGLDFQEQEVPIGLTAKARTDFIVFNKIVGLGLPVGTHI